jgi:hypothetical protein
MRLKYLEALQAGRAENHERGKQAATNHLDFCMFLTIERHHINFPQERTTFHIKE